MRLQQIIRHEANYMLRQNPKVVLMLFLIPLLYTLLFGFAYSANVVKHIPTVIYDQDQTPASFALLQAFADSERYKIVAQVSSQEEMEQFLYEDEALVALVIPPKFSQDIKLGNSSQVMVTINTPNLMFSNSILGTFPEIIQTVSAGMGQKSLEGLSQMPSQALATAAPIRLALRVLNNPTLSYNNFMLPGLGANGLQLAIMLSICYIFTREYATIGQWKETSAPLITLGKMLPYWIFSMISFIISLWAAIQVFSVPFRGDVGSLLLIGSAFTFAIVNVGAFFSVIAPNEVASVQLPMLYIMPAFLFSNYSWPALAMNEFSHLFSAILPLTYAADTIRDILLAGYAPSLVTNAAILFAFGSLLFLITSCIFSLRRKKLLRTSKEEVLL
jgi:ABC-2 type transport system permease protein